MRGGSARHPLPVHATCTTSRPVAMHSTWKIASVVLPLVSLAAAVLPDARLHAPTFQRPSVPVVAADDVVPVSAATGAALPPLNTTYTFDQLIDHNNPSLGTFKQRFWTTWEFYETGKRSCSRIVWRS